ncbi:hypothetical protein R1flu_027429 [Riccia fluitans]|uniref:phosphomevalonate kinase n=1 Tax=Riccia fluitans TaxID=41844 RepID=A0ABD1XIV5_9MARC
MAVIVSAPGKVLIVGGYLVLEQPNIGLVLSTSARFYAIVKPLSESLAADSWSWAWSDVKVSSPQLFKETNYKLNLRDYSLKNVAPSEGGSPFVENVVSMAVAVAAEKASSSGSGFINSLLLQGLEIIIFGSNSFYSFRKQIEAQQLPLTVETLTSLPEFSPITRNPTEVDSDDVNMLPEVAKTGLGSSAAMTAAVAGAVLQYLNAVKLPIHGMSLTSSSDSELRETMNLVHAVSQAAHCTAQGKVGSGFDISAAVYGSQRYIRFSPSILATQEGGRRQTVVAKMKILMQAQWDGERSPYALPPGLSLIIGEAGYGGSHTPSLVGAVMKWRKQGTEQAERGWSGLASANLKVEAGLKRLKGLALSLQGAYLSTVQLCSCLSFEQWQGIDTSSEVRKVVEALLETRDAFELVRSLMREMGEAAGVPLEPPVQTELLDHTMRMNGVLFAGVPGAGGFDAVFAVTLGEGSRKRVEEEWSRKGVLSLPVTEDPQGVSLEVEDPRIRSVNSALRDLGVAYQL